MNTKPVSLPSGSDQVEQDIRTGSASSDSAPRAEGSSLEKLRALAEAAKQFPFNAKRGKDLERALPPARVLRMLDALEKAEEACATAQSIADRGWRYGYANVTDRAVIDGARASLQALKEET